MKGLMIGLMALAVALLASNSYAGGCSALGCGVQAQFNVGYAPQVVAAPVFVPQVQYQAVQQFDIVPQVQYQAVQQFAAPVYAAPSFNVVRAQKVHAPVVAARPRLFGRGRSVQRNVVRQRGVGASAGAAFAVPY